MSFERFQLNRLNFLWIPTRFKDRNGLGKCRMRAREREGFVGSD